MLTVPDIEIYAAFQGLKIEALSSYAAEALSQGTDLMWLATGLDVDPVDTHELRLLQRGVMAAAEGMEASKGYRAVLLSPFSAETIGGYSYERMMGSIRGGIPTGLLWFDVAVGYFVGATDIQNVGKRLFEADAALMPVSLTDGSSAFLGPQEQSMIRTTVYELPGVD